MRTGKLITGTLALALASAIAGGGTTAHAATPRIAGGPVITIDKAPFVVWVTNPSGSCTGAIVDPSTVWTAGHCLTNPDNTRMSPGQISVKAGLSDTAANPGQTRAVSALRVHPAFVNDVDVVQPDDIGVLKLAAPLTVTANVKPIATGGVPGAGAAVTHFGYGRQDDAVAPDGKLRSLDANVLDPGSCGPYNAIQFCTQTPAGTTCKGDSGGPVVSGGVLVGIHNGAFCQAGRPNRETTIAAPEIALFLGGSDAPPTAPRPGRTLYTYNPIVAQSMTCGADGFTGTGPMTVQASFSDQTTGALLQPTGPPVRTYAPADAGRLIACRVSVTNAGGTFTGQLMTTTRPIVPLRAPGLSIRLRGRRFYVGGTTDARSAVLVSRTRAGAVVRQRTIRWPSSSVVRGTLPVGAYTTCLVTPQTIVVAGGSACVNHRMGGSSASLLTALRTSRAGARFVVRVTVDPRLAARRVKGTVVQRVTRRGRTVRRKVSRVTLRSSVRIRSVPVPRRARLVVTIKVPRLKVDGIRARAGTRSIARRR